MAKINSLSATEIRKGYQKASFLVSDVADAFIQQVEANENELKAFLHFDPEKIRTRAKELDARREELLSEPMYGVPIAIKDVISTKGVPTSAGSRALEGYRPLFDASVIDALQKKGALIFGKTNCDEFAMGSSTENSAYGPTKNPWDLTRVPGGSSGGSAAAVSSRMVPLALGSDTGGSIRQPASFTGIIGLKCTYGLISRFGLIAYASSFDQIGPMARNIEDLAMCLEATAFLDKKDSTSLPDPHGYNYLESLQEPLPKMLAGIPKELLGEGINPAIRSKVLEAAKELEKIGISVEECSLPYLAHSLPVYYILAPAEASSNLARYDGVRYGLRKEANNIFDLYSGTRSAGFGAEVQRRILLGTFVLSSGYYDAYYLKAMKVRALIRNELNIAFQKYDFLITPTTPTPAFRLGEKTHNPLEMYLSDTCTIAVNLAGIPAISVPSGLVDGLPVGVQFWGPHFSERMLLCLSKAFLEQTDYNLLAPDLLKLGK